jgi:Ribbon-helix-helix protein, copG family
MKRTTVTLTDDLATRVEREAERRSIPVSAVVREALAAHLGVGDGPRSLPFAALARSDHRSTARDFEAILEAEWTRDRDR